MLSTSITVLDDPDLLISVVLEADRLKNNLYMEPWHFRNARQDWSDTKNAIDRPYALACKFNAIRTVDEYERHAKCVEVQVKETTHHYWRGVRDVN